MWARLRTSPFWSWPSTIRFEISIPDGMPRKLLDVSRIHALGWKAKTPLREGIAKAYDYFKLGT
jgi:GDP-L-fucose synthase